MKGDPVNEAVERFENEWQRGDRAVARQMAKDYVAERRAELEPILAKFTLEGLVDLVTAYRNAGREEDRIITDMWLLSEYKPQNINGSIQMGAAQVEQIVNAAADIATGQGRQEGWRHGFTSAASGQTEDVWCWALEHGQPEVVLMGWFRRIFTFRHHHDAPVLPEPVRRKRLHRAPVNNLNAAFWRKNSPVSKQGFWRGR